ncbi:MAG: hypothetical protein EOP23_20655 [Hyphomicrobiales bacterium]|nr:MAG: hypothetical protein EOP23_20655 [Hyphomicrobiales bacterium]
MKEIIIRCPTTQIPVRTGQLTTPTSFRAMAVTGTVEECAACGSTHTWDSREAWLIEAEDMPSRHQADAD